MKSSDIVSPEVRITHGIMDETNDFKAIVISAVIITNVIANSLVIAVIARYPQLREDRTTLFMFSLSVSDLAAGCTFMPISAALCSKATSVVVDTFQRLPNIHAFLFWWFGFNSMYSLCWLTASKAMVIVNPLRSEQLLTRERCYFIIGFNWLLGCVVACANFSVDVSWNFDSCFSDYAPVDYGWSLFYVLHCIVGGVLPVTVIIYSTARICIVVLHTRRQISAQAQAIEMGSGAVGNPGFVTAQAIRSSRNVLVICFFSFVMTTPIFVATLIRYLSRFHVSIWFSSLSLWIFECNTIVNGLLYLLLYQSVREKAIQIMYMIARRVWHV